MQESVLIKIGVAWELGNGHTIRFWKDSWVNDEGPLHLLAFADVLEEDLHRPVSDFVDDSGHWRWEHFQHLLPPHINLQIAATNPPCNPETTDSCYWALTSNGSFSIASGYEEDQAYNGRRELHNGNGYGNGQDHRESEYSYGEPLKIASFAMPNEFEEEWLRKVYARYVTRRWKIWTTSFVDAPLQVPVGS